MHVRHQSPASPPAVRPSSRPIAAFAAQIPLHAHEIGIAAKKAAKTAICTAAVKINPSRRQITPDTAHEKIPTHNQIRPHPANIRHPNIDPARRSPVHSHHRRMPGSPSDHRLPLAISHSQGLFRR